MKYFNSLSLSFVFFLAIFANMYYLCSLDPSGSMMLLLYLVIFFGYYICWFIMRKILLNKFIQENGMEMLLYLTIILFSFIEVSLVDYSEDYFFFKKRKLFNIAYSLVLLFTFILHRIGKFYKNICE